jgi:dolichyl-phosphate-mannose--protein O-mannosyl transferase
MTAARLPEALQATARKWASLTIVERATTVLLAVLVVGGVCLRIQGIDHPPWLTFDEDAFVPQAHRYLLGLPDTNDHPPLGKLLMAVGYLLLGNNPVGWRFAALCFGLQTIVVAYWLGRCLFDSRRVGWFAAAWVAADGSFLAYSRAGLLDGILVCLVLWSLLTAVTARSWRGVLAAAVLVGLATSVKWSGAFALIPATVALLLGGRTSRQSLCWLVLAPGVHVLLWIFALGITGQPNDIASVGQALLGLYRRHVFAGIHHSTLTSPWYSWLVLYRPLVVKLSSFGMKCRYATSLGHPLLWLSTSLLVVAWPLVMATRARRSRFACWLSQSTTGAGWILWSGWLGLLLPWMISRRTWTFSYHYLPSYGFGLIWLAGVVRDFERKRPRAVLALVAATLLVAAFYAPVWSELPLGPTEVNRRLIFVPWRSPFAAATCWSGT